MNICTALGWGLIQPWLPPPPTQEAVPPAATAQSPTGRKTPKGGKGGAGDKGAKKGPIPVSISSDATPHLKKAVEVNIT